MALALALAALLLRENRSVMADIELHCDSRNF